MAGVNLDIDRVLSDEMQKAVPYFNEEKFTQPIIIGGCHGGGTSITAKALRYLGFFLGNDAGDITRRKHHESKGFVKTAEAIISLLNPGGSKVMGTTSQEEWDTFYKNMDNPQKFQEALDRVNLKMIFSSYSFRVHLKDAKKPLPSTFRYGWKDPRACPTLKVWKHLFPKARFVIVHSDHKKGPSQSLEGNWFRNITDEATRKRLMFPRDLNLEKDDYYFFRYKNAFADVKKFNRFLRWLKINPLSQKEFLDLKKKIRYEN